MPDPGPILTAVDRERCALRVGEDGETAGSGNVVGGTYVFAPSEAARAAEASQSATAKYGSQCGGPGDSFGIDIIPPIGVWPSNHSVYVMSPSEPVFASQGKRPP